MIGGDITCNRNKNSANGSEGGGDAGNSRLRSGITRLNQTFDTLGCDQTKDDLSDLRANTDPTKGAIQVFVCRKCSHEWASVRKAPKISETGEMMPQMPRRCPNCRTTKWNDENLKQFNCKRCGHQWFTTKEPNKCPQCQSERWNVPVKTLTCDKCDYTWKKNEGPLPKCCPRCRSYQWNEKRVMHKCKCGAEFQVRNNVRNACSECGTTFYRCVCGQCGHVWDDDSGKRPAKCVDCGSEEWMNKKVPRKNIDAVPKNPMAIRGMAISLDLTQDDLRAAVLLIKGKNPVEVCMMTGLSMDRVITVRNDIRSVDSGDGAEA